MDTLARKCNEEIESRKKLVFETCPCCGTGDHIEFGVDTICCHCEWNSAEMYVNEGLMDNRFLAFKEQFDPKNKIVRKYDKNVVQLKEHRTKVVNSKSNLLNSEESHHEFFNRAEGQL